eukprot:CFRG0513T1
MHFKFVMSHPIATLLSLPVEVRQKSFSYLLPIDLMEYSLTCKQFYSDTQDHMVRVAVLYNALKRTQFYSSYQSKSIDDMVITTNYTTTRQEGFMYDKDVHKELVALRNLGYKWADPMLLLDVVRMLDDKRCIATPVLQCINDISYSGISHRKAWYLLLLVACFNGWDEVVDTYVAVDKVSPLPESQAINLDIPLQLACKHGYQNIVRTLVAHGVANPGSSEGKCLSTACGGGYEDIVSLLLLDKRVDPTVSDSESLLEAVFEGHLSIVQLLLNDGRANPAAAHSFALVNAISYGHIQITSLLLQDGRADPSSLNSRSWWEACGSGSMETIELLMKDARVDLSRPRALREAVDGGHADVVKLLLDMNLIDPNDARVGELVRVAAEKGYTEIVRMLLVDGRAIPTKGLAKASSFGFTSIVRMLVEDGRVDVPPATAVFKAKRKGFYEIVKLVSGYRTGATSD